MSDNIVSSRLISANHTSSVWATISTVPKLGEICLETDTKKIKVGNGTDTYADLPYYNEGFNTITNGTDSVVITGGTLTLTASGMIINCASEDSEFYDWRKNSFVSIGAKYQF